MEPRSFPECPLGLECTAFDEKEGYRWKWHNCINRSYCVGVCEAWYLPLVDVPSNVDYCWREVNLDYYPHNFTKKSFCAYMKPYGWGEAEPARIIWYENTFNGVSGYVNRNDFRHGFAMAVLLQWRYSHGNCKRDKYGLWWTTWGSPPKDARTRWPTTEEFRKMSYCTPDGLEALWCFARFICNRLAAYVVFDRLTFARFSPRPGLYEGPKNLSKNGKRIYMKLVRDYYG